MHMSANNTSADAPKYATLATWQALSGMSRSASYEAIGRGQLRALKLNGRTLIDVDAGLAWMASLPPAVIKAPHKRAA
jgi:hypothetical protein